MESALKNTIIENINEREILFKGGE